MAGKRRSDIVDPHGVAVYHCWIRAARQLFLLADSQKVESRIQERARSELPDCVRDCCERRAWVHDAEEKLAGLFGIDVAFHATLSSHLHLTLRSRPDVVKVWSDEEVCRRWLTITRIKRNGKLDVEPTQKRMDAELKKGEQRIAELRRRLSHVSWFMGTLSEAISRHVNALEGRTGTCWEGRYQIQALEDEISILTCGVYIDLNAIRAGMAKTPEESLFTSAYDRIQAMRQRKAAQQQSRQLAAGAGVDLLADGWMCNLTLDESRPVDAPEHVTSATSRRASDKGIVRATLDQFLTLLDLTGRQLVEGKTGHIPAELAPILQRLQINPEKWFDAITRFDQLFGRFVGTAASMGKVAERLKQKWVHGQTMCATVFSDATGP